jgi:hypothetical protein
MLSIKSATSRISNNRIRRPRSLNQNCAPDSSLDSRLLTRNSENVYRHRVMDGSSKLKDWALAIAARSTMRKARIALARRLASIMHAMLRQRTEFKAA